MTLLADRRKPARRRPAPAFDRLDDRTMLTASAVGHLASSTLVAHHVAAAKGSHTVFAATVAHKATTLHAKVAQAKVHAAVKAHVVSVKPLAKAPVNTTVATPNLKAKPFSTTLSRSVQKILSTHKVQQSLSPEDTLGTFAATPIAGLLTPAQVRTAYGITSLPNGGAGTTIGIVDVFVDPVISSDLATFSAQYGLPQLDGANGHGTFTSLAQAGAPNSPTDGSSTDTSLETALDVEWAHSIAPLANIVLYQVSSFLYSDLLNGVNLLANTPGISVVSVSYGGGEFSGETSLDSLLTSTTAAVDFSTGDGSTPSFPATSSSVLAVGGTGLYVATTRGRYGFETAWGGISGDGAGGGGVSTQYALPAFQSANGVSFARRAIPDISAIADPLTSVSVYSSWDNPASGWTGVGGTSLACPVVSAMVDLAQENRINNGLAPLTSPQINAKLYAAYNSPSYLNYFHDITVGNNSRYNAVTGYDRATGIGSPIGNTFVTLLSS